MIDEYMEKEGEVKLGGEWGKRKFRIDQRCVNDIKTLDVDHVRRLIEKYDPYKEVVDVKIVVTLCKQT